MFARIGQALQAQGLEVGNGTIVDATTIGAPSSAKYEDKKRDLEMEMHRTRKGQQWFFGMKLHIGVDSETALAHSAVVTAAHVHVKHLLPELLHGNEDRAGEAMKAMLSGTIDFQDASTPGVMGNAKGRKARILAVSGSKRLSALPDVPTFAEAGVKNFGLINFTGLWAPEGTPQSAIDRLQKDEATAMASADMKTLPKASRQNRAAGTLPPSGRI